MAVRTGKEIVWVEMKGFEGLAAALKGLGTEMSWKVVKNACRRAVVKMNALMQTQVPSRTGRLRRNIRLRTVVSNRVVGAEIVVNKRGDKKNPQNAYYWAFVEWPHRIRTGSRWGSDETTYMQKAGRRSRSKKVYRGSTNMTTGRYFATDTWNASSRWAAEYVFNAVKTAVEKAAEKQRRGVV